MRMLKIKGPMDMFHNMSSANRRFGRTLPPANPAAAFPDLFAMRQTAVGRDT